MKKAISVVTNTPALKMRGFPSSVSGFSAHKPKPMNDNPTIQLSDCGEIRLASQAPTEAANA